MHRSTAPPADPGNKYFILAHECNRRYNGTVKAAYWRKEYIVQRDPDMIDLFLITGFFGAGKTVLINKLVAQAASRGRSAGVILNEYGDISFDGSFIGLEDRGRVIEISGRSILAEHLSPPFLEALDRFSQNPVDMLVVEMSGFSNPADMARLINQFNEKNGGAFNYACTVCVVDCASFIRLVQSVPLVRKQIMASSLVLINKADTVDARTLKEVNMIIAKLHERARILQTVQAEFPMELMYDAPVLNVRDSSTELSPGVSAGRPDSFVLEGEGGLDQVLKFLREAGKTVYRAKGYWSDMGEAYYIESVNGEVTKRPAGNTPVGNGIVIIARHGRDIYYNFEKHLSDCGITIR